MFRMQLLFVVKSPVVVLQPSMVLMSVHDTKPPTVMLYVKSFRTTGGQASIVISFALVSGRYKEMT